VYSKYYGESKEAAAGRTRDTVLQWESLSGVRRAGGANNAVAGYAPSFPGSDYRFHADTIIKKSVFDAAMLRNALKTRTSFRLYGQAIEGTWYNIRKRN
jgi:hypothetical protein